LFAIWDGLKDAGITIPYPQQDVYIKQLPEASRTQDLDGMLAG
jgi:potassium efflux system protein